MQFERSTIRRDVTRLAAGLLVAAAATLAVVPGAAAAAPEPTTVHVSGGALHGVVDTTARRFLGVRYARPPIGARRWRAPAPAVSWTGTRQATHAGARCPQAGTTAAEPASTTEDCLFLNVTTPRERSATPRPVMVWIHGGGGTSGSGDEYDAQRLASRGNVVVVTINYRLDVLGQLAVPGLRDGGTFGLADQLLALRWVKRNAAAFGGDPRTVTAFGESHGGFSVCAMLTMPAARGLFERASMSSGDCSIDFPPGGFYPGTPGSHKFVSRHHANRAGLDIARALGCTGKGRLACLRRVPVSRLLKQTTDAYAYGTRLLPEDPEQALRAGHFERIPVISGTNAAEARGQMGIAEEIEHITPEAYVALLHTAFGGDAARVLARYPLRAGELPAERYAQVMTDAAWACPTATTDRLLARGTALYPYEFADPDAPNVNGITAPGFTPGPAHASDLPSLFDLGGRSLLQTAAQRRLGDRMIDYWTRFARTGDPNGPGAPRWQRSDGGGRVLQLAPGARGIKPVQLIDEHRCRFWATVDR